MWMYEDHPEEALWDAVNRVEEIVLELGAELVGTRRVKTTTYLGDTKIIEDDDVNVYKFKEYYFDIDTIFFSDCPYIVLEFGDSVETIRDDADAFPYNLSDEELIQEVKYSLEIEPYPKNLDKGDIF